MDDSIWYLILGFSHSGPRESVFNIFLVCARTCALCTAQPSAIFVRIMQAKTRSGPGWDLDPDHPGTGWSEDEVRIGLMYPSGYLSVRFFILFIQDVVLSNEYLSFRMIQFPIISFSFLLWFFLLFFLHLSFRMRNYSSSSSNIKSYSFMQSDIQFNNIGQPIIY